ncbi:MAG: MTH1187 family thiamine-binding protein [Candidatus Hodarchaeales archaeon]
MSSKTSIIAELTLSPRSTESVSLSNPIKEALKILHSVEGLTIETHAMGTNISTQDLDVLLDAVKKIQNYLIERYPRVVTTLKIDQRKDKPDRKMEDKISSVKF